MRLSSTINSNKADSSIQNAELDVLVDRPQSGDDGSIPSPSSNGASTELETGDCLNKTPSEDTQDTTVHQQQRQLLSKVIELENKVNINAKKEVLLIHSFIQYFLNCCELKLEWNRQRVELETRNAKLQSELDRLRGHSDDVGSRLAAVQSLYDRYSFITLPMMLQIQQFVNLGNCIPFNCSKTISNEIKLS